MKRKVEYYVNAGIDGDHVTLVVTERLFSYEPETTNLRERDVIPCPSSIPHCYHYEKDFAKHAGYLGRRLRDEEVALLKLQGKICL